MYTFSFAALFTSFAAFADEPAGDLAESLRKLNPNVLSTTGEKTKQLSSMVSDDLRKRRDQVHERERKAWSEIATRAQWEKYRDEKITALRETIASFPPAPKQVKTQITKTIEGDGYVIENTVFESRPGFWVTANLYRPAKPGKQMPGILIIHSHHNPKTEGELQDMGVTWAKAGCVVLVMDQLGHGERRQHPFVNEKSYPESYRVSRQDYYFRYNSGVQLGLVDETLIGWMAWDVMRGVDVLLARPGINKDAIILLGSVAGGGDPAAVTAALDQRIKAVVPFNFGGPQPETRFPLPPGAEQTFNYMGGGSWESTRNIRQSGQAGFFPWVIVAAAAPRGLVNAHEFAWDKEHDPAWSRYQKIWGFYDAADKLSSSHGSGSVSGKPPEATHCNNIGFIHRKEIHPALEKWFGIKAEEAKDRHKSDELQCLTEEVSKQIKPKTLVDMLKPQTDSLLKKFDSEWENIPAAEKGAYLRKTWSKHLGIGNIQPEGKVIEATQLGEYTVERIDIRSERDIHVPTLLLLPKKKEGELVPVIVGVCGEGKDRFLKENAEAIAHLLQNRVAVCLPDVRATGETRIGDNRSRTSSLTSLCSTEQMLGGTMLGGRINDLRAVLAYLAVRRNRDIHPARTAMWGDSFAKVNGPDQNLAVPYEVDKYPNLADPTGGLLAAFAGLYHESKTTWEEGGEGFGGQVTVKAMAIRGGLVNYRSILENPFLYVPYDAVVPGAIAAGDLEPVYTLKAGRPTRIEGMVDGLNLQVSTKTWQESSRQAFGKQMRELEFHEQPRPSKEVADWLIKVLKR